jgi:hypothetical protein
MMKRTVSIALVLAVILATIGAAGCGEKMVKVQTGEKVVCSYGETVSSTVKTIEVPASKASAYTVVTRMVLCPRHRAIEALYAAAQSAIRAGDLAAAQAKLDELLALDPNYRKAANQRADIASGKKPVADGGTGADTGTGDTGGTDPGATPTGPVASLLAYVPATIAGYTAEPVIEDPAALTRQYIPSAAGPVVVAVVVAEQMKDAESAKAAATRTIASQYPTSRATMTVEGRTLDFGVNGAKFAAVAWNEGAITVAIEVYGSGSTAALKSALQSLATSVIP